MRSIRRTLVGLAIVATATAPSVLMPAKAFAGTCYTVQVGSEGVVVCP